MAKAITKKIVAASESKEQRICLKNLELSQKNLKSVSQCLENSPVEEMENHSRPVLVTDWFYATRSISLNSFQPRHPMKGLEYEVQFSMATLHWNLEDKLEQR